MLNISNFYEDWGGGGGGGGGGCWKSAIDKLLITFFHVVISTRNYQEIGEIESK